MKTPLLEESRKWDVHARCKKGVDPELFFVIDDDRASALRDAQEAKAKEVCKKCPVSGNCLDYAIEYTRSTGCGAGRRQRNDEPRNVADPELRAPGVSEG